MSSMQYLDFFMQTIFKSQKMYNDVTYFVYAKYIINFFLYAIFIFPLWKVYF